jgi:hypothetical protein
VLPELAGFYEFTTASEFGEFEEYDKFTVYGFVGNPHTKNRDGPRPSPERKTTAYFYVAREFGAIPDNSGKRSAVHVALQAPLRRFTGPRGQIIAAPDPHGISGCGVWRIKLNAETAEPSAPQLAGIGIAYHARERVFVATRAAAAAVAVTELWRAIDEGRTPISTLELHDDQR